MDLELTKEEIEHIELRRALQNQTKRREQAPWYILKLASDYAKWLIDNGAGNTYSTFCNDFGCDLPSTVKRQEAYSVVSDLLERAYQDITLWQS